MSQTQAATPAVEHAWHLQQVLGARLTERTREDHRDLISWLEQQYNLCCSGVPEPAVQHGLAARRKRRRRTPRRRLHQHLAGQAG